MLVADFDRNNKLEVKVYKNGRDVNIVYLPNKQNAEETEPLDCLPSQIQSSAEEQIALHENGNEIGRKIIQIPEEKIND